MLIIEDGTGVVGSDSYVSRADYIAYALSIGITIADADAADNELRLAAIYIDQHEPKMKGYRVARDQSMAYPRHDVVIDGWSWSSDEIPRNLVLCQLAFALDVHAGEDLWNRSVNPSAAVKSERVEGAVAVTYAVNEKGRKLSKTSSGDALLASLLRNNGLFSVGLVRS